MSKLERKIVCVYYFEKLRLDPDQFLKNLEPEFVFLYSNPNLK